MVDVQMKGGTAYQGVLKAVSPTLSVALALAHDKAKEATRANTERLMQLEFADIISVSVLPDLNPSLGSKGKVCWCISPSQKLTPLCRYF